MPERDEMLERVYRRARVLWWQRRVAPMVAATMVLVGVISAPLLLRDGDGSPREVAAINQPTTTVDETTTTEVAVEETTSTTTDGVGTSTRGPTTTRPRIAAPATTTSLVCRNSFDERCGPFRWDPEPGSNAPATVTITFAPAQPRAGESVTVTLTLSDPDGPIGGCSASTNFGDGQSITGDCLPPPDCKSGGARGPWTPPPRKSDSSTSSQAHTYAAPGTYTVEHWRSEALGCDGPNPYANDASGSATITVSPAPA